MQIFIYLLQVLQFVNYQAIAKIDAENAHYDKTWLSSQ